MKKYILCALIIFSLIIMPAYAKSKAKSCNLKGVINEFGADVESVSISIKDLDNGKVIYILITK